MSDALYNPDAPLSQSDSSRWTFDELKRVSDHLANIRGSIGGRLTTLETDTSLKDRVTALEAANASNLAAISALNTLVASLDSRILIVENGIITTWDGVPV